MRAYISKKIGADREFKVTHAIIEPEIEPNGQTFYCVVAYDANNGLKVNLAGFRNLENAILELSDILRKLVPLVEAEAIKQWEKDKEEALARNKGKR
ncbi:MAG: hypothetical protein PHY47_20600 [Lachnospiraceae bacterium]|jgi:hypothetical protein|nr:hypothetical protein [Lachnospiraceae bacterium]